MWQPGRHGEIGRFTDSRCGEVSVIHRNSSGEEVDTAMSLFALDWEDFKEVIERSDPTAKDFMDIAAQRRAALPEASA